MDNNLKQYLLKEDWENSNIREIRIYRNKANFIITISEINCMASNSEIIEQINKLSDDLFIKELYLDDNYYSDNVMNIRVIDINDITIINKDKFSTAIFNYIRTTDSLSNDIFIIESFPSIDGKDSIEYINKAIINLKKSLNEYLDCNMVDEIKIHRAKFTSRLGRCKKTNIKKYHWDDMINDLYDFYICNNSK